MKGKGRHGRYGAGDPPGARGYRGLPRRQDRGADICQGAPVQRWVKMPILPALLASLACACQTVPAEPLGWVCTREVRDGEVSARSALSLTHDGSPRQEWSRWA